MYLQYPSLIPTMSIEPTIECRIIKVVAEMMGVDQRDVKPGTNFVADLGCDSLDLAELVMACEDEFELEISDEEAEKMLKVQDAVNFITKCLSGPRSEFIQQHDNQIAEVIETTEIVKPLPITAKEFLDWIQNYTCWHPNVVSDLRQMLASMPCRKIPGVFTRGDRVKVNNTSGFSKGSPGVVDFVEPLGAIWVTRDGSGSPMRFFAKELDHEA